jgi:hypothetical protein
MMMMMMMLPQVVYQRWASDSTRVTRPALFAWATVMLSFFNIASGFVNTVRGR